MKNLLIYTNSSKEFSEENKTLVKIHIDNSIQLGWPRQDILLYTNFMFEYNGINAITVPDNLDCTWDRTSNKIFVIEWLLERNMLDDICWYHDFDAYENESVRDLTINKDMALTGYGYKDQMNGGSFFFKPTSLDIFRLWCKTTMQKVRTRADEKTLTDLTRSGSISKDRYEELNITYNFGQRCPSLCYKYADKPLRVLHFHPHYRYHSAHYWNLDIFMYGKNPQQIPMMSNRLIKLFNKHGIQ